MSNTLNISTQLVVPENSHWRSPSGREFEAGMPCAGGRVKMHLPNTNRSPIGSIEIQVKGMKKRGWERIDE